MRIAIVSDAWRPQINGVVRTVETVVRLLQAEGHEIEVFGPDRFRTVPCPTYPEIRLSLFPSARLHHMLKLFQPDAIHLVTEGPLGWSARAFCRKRGLPFTTAYHTRFPEYVRARVRLPLAWSYAFVRRFHAPSSAVLVVAQSIRDELAARGFKNLAPWSRGVDITAFQPQPRVDVGDPRPIWLYAGRVAVEKNIEAFLDLPQPHRYLWPGDGRGSGLGRAGGGLSRAGSARRRDPPHRRRGRRGSAGRLPAGHCLQTGGLPPARRELHLAAMRAAVPRDAAANPAHRLAPAQATRHARRRGILIHNGPTSVPRVSIL